MAATEAWRCGPFDLPLGRTLVMGIVNVTPDSFSDGGLWLDPDRAVEHGVELASGGADIVDVGGESTRPGSEAVPVEEELRRVIPVVGRLAAEGICVSVDTRHAAVAHAAVDAGAAIVNDVSAGLGDPAGRAGTIDVAARHGAGLVLMHMRGEPGSMQLDVHYDDCVAEVTTFLAGRAAAARAAGVAADAIAVDPGIGFGKTLRHNLQLLDAMPELAALGYPVLVGTSRKSMFERIAGMGTGERLEGTIVTSVWAILGGAAIVRVHDADEMRIAADGTDLARSTW